jgi:hypothetical protein
MMKNLNSIFIFCILILMYMLTMFIVNIITKPKDCTVKYGRFWLWNVIFSLLLAIVTYILFTYLSPNTQEKFGKNCNTSSNYKKLQNVNDSRMFISNFPNPNVNGPQLRHSCGYNCNVAGVSQDPDISRSCLGASLTEVVNGSANSRCCPEYSTGSASLNPFMNGMNQEWKNGRPDLYDYNTLSEACPCKDKNMQPQCSFNYPVTPCAKGEKNMRENFQINPQIVNDEKKKPNIIKLHTRNNCPFCVKAKDQLDRMKRDGKHKEVCDAIIIVENSDGPVPRYHDQNDKELVIGFVSNDDELIQKLTGHSVENFTKRSELFEEKDKKLAKMPAEEDQHAVNQHGEHIIKNVNYPSDKIYLKTQPLNYSQGEKCCNNYYTVNQYLEPAGKIVDSMAGSTVDILNPNGYFCPSYNTCGFPVVTTN